MPSNMCAHGSALTLPHVCVHTRIWTHIIIYMSKHNSAITISHTCTHGSALTPSHACVHKLLPWYHHTYVYTQFCPHIITQVCAHVSALMPSHTCTHTYMHFCLTSPLMYISTILPSGHHTCVHMVLSSCSDTHVYTHKSTHSCHYTHLHAWFCPHIITHVYTHKTALMLTHMCMHAVMLSHKCVGCLKCPPHITCLIMREVEWSPGQPSSLLFLAISPFQR